MTLSHCLTVATRGIGKKRKAHAFRRRAAIPLAATHLRPASLPVKVMLSLQSTGSLAAAGASLPFSTSSGPCIDLPPTAMGLTPFERRIACTYANQCWCRPLADTTPKGEAVEGASIVYCNMAFSEQHIAPNARRCETASKPMHYSDSACTLTGATDDGRRWVLHLANQACKYRLPALPPASQGSVSRRVCAALLTIAVSD